MNVWIWLNDWKIKLSAINQSKLQLIQLIMYSTYVLKEKWSKVNWIFFHYHAISYVSEEWISYLERITWWGSGYVCGCASPNNWTASNWAGASAGGSICWNWQHIDFMSYLYWLSLSYLTLLLLLFLCLSLFCRYWSLLFDDFAKSHWSIQAIHVYDIQFERTFRWLGSLFVDQMPTVSGLYSAPCMHVFLLVS